MGVEEYIKTLPYKKIQPVIIELMMDDVRFDQGKTFEEAGAYQMANYVVYRLDIIDELIENYAGGLCEHFNEEFEALKKEAREQDESDEADYGRFKYGS